MKKLILISVLACAFLTMPLEEAKSQVNAAKEVAASAMLSVSIVVPIAARETSQLSFGKFYPGQKGGTITVNPQGNSESSFGIIITASVPTAGIFAISGQGDATYAINLPNGPAILTNGDGNTMEVSNWVSFPENGDAKVRLAGGSQEVRVGATLRMGSLDQNPKGVYSGRYEITFGYN